jgi:hypothetical protein
MKLLPRVSEFTYNGVRRVAIEKGPDERGCGLFTTQVVPEIGPRTFKPERMIDCKQLSVLPSLWYIARSIRVTLG